MHADQLPINVDIARQLIHEQFPEWDPAKRIGHRKGRFGEVEREE